MMETRKFGIANFKDDNGFHVMTFLNFCEIHQRRLKRFGISQNGQDDEEEKIYCSEEDSSVSLQSNYDKSK